MGVLSCAINRFTSQLKSVTLLKNEGNMLPFDPAKLHTRAVLGPDAWPAESPCFAPKSGPLPQKGDPAFATP